MKKYLLLIFICSACLSAQISGNAKTKLQSLVLPGWGEQSLGESKRAQGFFLRETALWLVFLGGEKATAWYESDYRAFAGLHADVSMAGKNYLFAVNLGHYYSFEEYNESKGMTFKILYGGITDDIAKSIPFFRKTKEYTDYLLDRGHQRKDVDKAFQEVASITRTIARRKKTCHYFYPI